MLFKKVCKLSSIVIALVIFASVYGNILIQEVEATNNNFYCLEERSVTAIPSVVSSTSSSFTEHELDKLISKEYTRKVEATNDSVPENINLYELKGITDRTNLSKYNEFIGENRTGGVYNVRDYGAKGDGITDDTIAFVDALTAANGSTVIVPPGTYVVNSITTDGLNINMVGIGNPLLQLKASKAYNRCLYIKNANSIHLEGIAFDAERLVHGLDLDLACVWIRDSKNIEISRCTFQNASREALVFFGVTTDLNIVDCVFHNVSSHCWITGGYRKRVKFLRNYSTNGRAQGFEINPANTQISSDILIEGNTFIDIGSSACSITQATDVTIRNNRFKDTLNNYTYLVRLQKPKVSGTGYSTDRIYIEDNICENPYKIMTIDALTSDNNPHCGTVILKGNIVRCRVAFITVNDTFELITDGNNIRSSVGYELKNVKKALINSDIVDTTGTCIQITGDTDLSICRSTLGTKKIYTVLSGTPNIKIKQTIGNFRDISKGHLVYATLVTGCKNVSSSELIARYDNTTKVLTLPLAGDICRISGQIGAAEVTEIAGVNDSVVTILSTYETTYKTTGNIVTKTGDDVTVSAGKVFRVIYFNGKWYEV